MSESKRTGGRKTLPPGEKRKNWGVMLSDAEQAVITQAAQQAGDAPRVWARKMLLQAAKVNAGLPAEGAK